MEEEIMMLLDEAKESNDKTIAHLTAELEKIRAGKATPSMLDRCSDRILWCYDSSFTSC